MRAILAIAAACAVGLPAAAAEPFDSFKDLCLDTAGQRGPSTERALARGWLQAPDELAAQLQTIGGDLKDPRMLLSFDPAKGAPASAYALVLADAQNVLDGFSGGGAACALMELGDSGADAKGQLREWIGFEPAEDGEEPTWVYSLREGAPHSENALFTADDAQISQAISERPLHIVGTLAGERAALLLLTLSAQP